MTLQQVTASDIASWDSLQDIADSFEKRGLKPRPNLGEDHELILQLDDDEFVTIVEGGPGESATEFKPENRTRHTNLVATNDYESFTFITRVRSWEGQQHGRIKHQKLSFSKEQFQRDSGEKNTILQKLNSIEYGSSAAIYDTLYDTRQVVKEFYQQFESLRTDLVQEVSGIPDDRGDAKQRYVQVLLDRMIFLYFIQEKRLLDRNPDYLHEQPSKVVDDDDDRYEEFYEPLFFDYLAEDKQNPEFGKLPYLNGGLFAKNPIEEEFEDAKLGESPEETNELFDDILDFLSDWNWNVDERLDIVDPKNLSPAVLGHIFEQTVNQKEMGAYYTPEEITGFMARRTVHPYLLDQLNEAVGASYDDIDDVFGFIGAGASGESAAVADGGMVTQQAPTENMNVGHVETLYHDILKEAKLLDPAVGSGAFLLAGQEVLLDLYMQCIEFFQRLEDEGQGWELSSRTRDELDTIASGKGNASLYAKRTIILKNLYGVDIDDGAVEICKLRLWLSMVADIEDEPGEVEPLPNIDFNIRQGNSLIGYVSFMDDDDTEGAQDTLSNWGAVKNKVEAKYGEVLNAIEEHKDATSSEVARKKQKDAEQLIETYSEDFDEAILERFHEMGYEEMELSELQDFSPFHWVLEFADVYADGGFNVIVGNPPWDRLKPLRDDFFSKHDEVFRTRMPEDKDEVQEELLEDPEVEEAWEEYQQEMKMRGDYFSHAPDYELQSPKVGGTTTTTENDLSALFFERVFDIAKDDSYVSQVLPGVIFNGASAKDLRMNLLDSTELKALPIFTNRGIFEAIDNRFVFGVPVFKGSGRTEEVYGGYRDGDLSLLQNLDADGIRITRKVLEQFSPEARIFPYLESEQEVNVLESIFEHPPISKHEDEGWYAQPYAEIHRTNDRDRFVESEGDYPVLGGSNIYQFAHDPKYVDNLEATKFWSVDEDKDPEKSAKRRIREKNYRKLKRGLYDAFDGSGSQKKFVNKLLNQHRGEELSNDDVLLDSTEYRIVYRDIARANDERTMIASVVPKGTVCHNKLHTVRPYKINPTEEDLSESPLHSVYERIFSDNELFVALGLLNSIPFDFLMRTKIDTTVVMYKFQESQMPRLTKGDNWFEYISQRAARLNCYGEEFEEMRDRLGGVEPATDEKKREELQAEIDAASFHAYGLNREDTQFVLDDFHRVNNPRRMTDEYFELVLEKYDELDETGPHT